MDHIIQRSCGYIFRMTIPADLRQIIGKRELRYSLKERSLLHAKHKAHRISGQLKRLFAQLRSDNMPLEQAQINRIIRNTIQAAIAEMEHNKATGKPLSRSQLSDHNNSIFSSMITVKPYL